MKQKVVPLKKSKKAADAKTLLENFAKKINVELERELTKRVRNPFGVSRSEKNLGKLILEHIKEHDLRPAKRLRGSFIYHGYKLLGGRKEKDILRAAMSIELIHTALLMHDDFMDQDATRRGLPTTHEYFKVYHKKKKYRFDPLHFGETMAVNVGDVALMMGFRILGESNFDNKLKLKALNRTLLGIENTAYGQSYDNVLEVSGKAGEHDILNLHHAKTAIYTYENPLHIGALLAGAKQKDLGILSKYAVPGGIAFQLQDDILGLFGDTKKTGKPTNSDLKQGKMTLLIIKALELSYPEQKNTILKIWGRRDINKKDSEIVRNIVREIGSLEYSKRLAIKLARNAQKAIPAMKDKKWNKKSISYLDGIAEYMVERDF